MFPGIGFSSGPVRLIVDAEVSIPSGRLSVTVASTKLIRWLTLPSGTIVPSVRGDSCYTGCHVIKGKFPLAVYDIPGFIY